MEAQNKSKVMELERMYIYPDDVHGAGILQQVMMNVTGIDHREDGSHIVHTSTGDRLAMPGWVKIMHKVPKEI